MTNENNQLDEFALLEAEINDEQTQKEHEQKQSEQRQEQIETTEALLLPAVDAGHALLAPNWVIDSEEKEAFAKAAGRVLDKYFPEGLGVERFKEEIALVVICFGVVFKNKSRPLRVEKENKDEGEKNAEA